MTLQLGPAHKRAAEEAFNGFSSQLFSVPRDPSDPELSVEIHYLHRRSPRASSPTLLLLHGHPQNHLIWHRVVGLLDAAEWNIVIPDIRGRGQSSIPLVSPSADALSAESARYSKRSMARDNFELMRSLGYDTFYVVGHDRGGRVTHRLLADYAAAVQKAIIIDIAPTIDMYTHANMRFAQMYWHWFFLIQPQPLPERFISTNPDAYLQACVSKFDPDQSIFTDWATASYLDGIRTEEQVHALAEDYRASKPGGVDWLLDHSDRKEGKRIKTPVYLLWGDKGLVGGLYSGALDWWRLTLDHVDGHGLDAGHYIPEEKPQDIADAIKSFFA